MKSKKILFSFILLLSLIIGGCGNKSYINNVKSLVFDNGQSVNELVQSYLEGGESYILNPENDYLGLQYGLSLLPMFINDPNFSRSDFAVEISTFLKDSNYKQIQKIKPKWKVEGKTSNGKIIIVKSKNILVRIPTFKDGDYTSVYKESIEIFNLNTNNKIYKSTINTHRSIIKFLKAFNKN